MVVRERESALQYNDITPSEHKLLLFVSDKRPQEAPRGPRRLPKAPKRSPIGPKTLPRGPQRPNKTAQRTARSD